MHTRKKNSLYIVFFVFLTLFICKDFISSTISPRDLPEGEPGVAFAATAEDTSEVHCKYPERCQNNGFKGCYCALSDECATRK